MRRIGFALLLLLCAGSASAQFVSLGASAEQFYPTYDARYLRLAGTSPMTGTLTGIAGTVAAPAYRFGAGWGMFSPGTYIAWGDPGTAEVYGALGGSGLTLQSDGTLCMSNSATDPVAPAGVCWSQSPAGSWLSSGPVVTPDLRFTGTATSGLRVKSLTTLQRDALTAAVGDVIWNSTALRFQMYNGATWHEWLRRDGTDTLPAGSGTATYKPSGVIHYNTTAQATTGTSEEVLATITIPASTLVANGQAVRIRATGTSAANGNAKVMRLRLTNTTGTALAAISIPSSAAQWVLETTIVRTGAAAELAFGSAVSGAAVTTTGTTLAANTANAIVVVVTGTTAAAVGDATFTGLIVEALP